jgi:acylpyruvate hydrolase
MKIICIGRNYAEHAAELGNSVTAAPLFFLKPDSAILTKKHAFYLPDWTDDMHYEVEVVIKINKLGKAIEKKFANRY